VGKSVESAMTLPSTISEEEKELAANAQSHFDASKFKECLTVLKRLSTLRPNDTKVKQNKAVADYYASGFKFTDVYLNTLDAISENIDEPEAVEDLEHCVHYYNKALLLSHVPVPDCFVHWGKTSPVCCSYGGWPC